MKGFEGMYWPVCLPVNTASDDSYEYTYIKYKGLRYHDESNLTHWRYTTINSGLMQFI